MKRIKISHILLVFFIINLNNLLTALESSIVVKVDNKIITSIEVKNKIIRTLILSGNEVNQKNIDNIKRQTLESLIFNKIKETELEKFDYKISSQRLNSYLNKITENNIKEFKRKFVNYGLDYQLFINEMELELKWQQFIYFKYKNKIEIDENIIKDDLDRIIKSASLNKEVNLSEIEVFQDEKISNDIIISKIMDEIKKNGFENAALKFSVSNTSTQKGNLGWINVNVLSEKILKEISNIKPGQISKPIVQTNSILFLKLNSERNIQTDDLVNKEKIKQSLVQRKQNELFNLYSKSHLSKLKNSYFIQYN